MSERQVTFAAGRMRRSGRWPRTSPRSRS